MIPFTRSKISHLAIEAEIDASLRAVKIEKIIATAKGTCPINPKTNGLLTP
jgi:hypothetical protein